MRGRMVLIFSSGKDIDVTLKKGEKVSNETLGMISKVTLIRSNLGFE